MATPWAASWPWRRFWTALGKDVLVCNAFAVPPNLRFLDPAAGTVSWASTSPPSSLADREVLMILDTTAWAQLGGDGRRC